MSSLFITLQCDRLDEEVVEIDSPYSVSVAAGTEVFTFVRVALHCLSFLSKHSFPFLPPSNMLLSVHPRRRLLHLVHRRACVCVHFFPRV